MPDTVVNHSALANLNAALRFARRALPPNAERVPGSSLTLYREASHVTAAAVAERLDLSKQRISAMESTGAPIELAARYRAAVDQIWAETGVPAREES